MQKYDILTFPKEIIYRSPKKLVRSYPESESL